MLLSVIFFTDDYSQAQILGSWEKHVVCKSCTLENAINYPPGNLDFADSIHGILVGDDTYYGLLHVANVYVTSNGGRTWNLNSDTDAGLSPLVSVNYLSTDFAASIFTYQIGYTNDKGLHWKYIPSLNPKYEFLSGKIYSLSNYYKISVLPSKRNSAILERSTDSLQTFFLVGDTLSFGTDQFLQTYILDSLNIWIVMWPYLSLKNYCLNTKDGGNHWDKIYPVNESTGKYIFTQEPLFSNNSNGSIYLVNPVIVDSNKHVLYKLDIYFTTDGGASWQGDSTNHGRLHRVVSSGGSNLWGFVGTLDYLGRLHCDTLAYTPNNGKNWYYDSESIRGDSVVLMVWKDSVHGYIISYKDSTITFDEYIPQHSIVNQGENISYDGPLFRVLPTITSGQVKLTAYQSYTGYMYLYDILGRLVLQKTLSVVFGEKAEFSVSDLPLGLYFLKFSSTGLSRPVRIIKQ